MKDDFEEMEEEEDGYEEMEEMVDTLEDEISDMESHRDGLIDDARERVRESYYDEYYDCLSDPVDCLVNQRGYYSSASEMVNAGFVSVDDEAIVSDLADQGDYGELNHYDGSYDEVQDSAGQWWVIMQIQ
jgi:predicted nuclease with TOPRIM domain